MKSTLWMLFAIVFWPPERTSARQIFHWLSELIFLFSPLLIAGVIGYYTKAGFSLISFGLLTALVFLLFFANWATEKLISKQK